jgi:hypothetical protein
MSDAIKRMLAERAALEAERAVKKIPRDRRTDEIMELIDRRQPELDSRWNGEGWRPSSLLRLRYCIAASSLRIGPKTADRIIRQALKGLVQ